MYKPTDSIYIVSNYTGAIPYLRQNGPIVNPIKVTLNVARKCLIGGIRIAQYDPATKKVVALNLQNLMDDKKFENKTEAVKKEEKKVVVQAAPTIPPVGRGNTTPIMTTMAMTDELKEVTPAVESKDDAEDVAAPQQETQDNITSDGNDGYPASKPYPNQSNNKKNKKNR